MLMLVFGIGIVPILDLELNYLFKKKDIKIKLN
jgi:hypothetical protein